MGHGQSPHLPNGGGRDWIGDFNAAEGDHILLAAGTTYTVSSYQGHSLQWVAGAYCRLVDDESGEELARYDLTEDASTETAMVFGELYRHQHEWKIWRDVPLPEGKVLIPGLLGHASNYVEHPELIADTIAAQPSPVELDHASLLSSGMSYQG